MESILLFQQMCLEESDATDEVNNEVHEERFIDSEFLTVLDTDESDADGYIIDTKSESEELHESESNVDTRILTDVDTTQPIQSCIENIDTTTLSIIDTTQTTQLDTTLDTTIIPSSPLKLLEDEHNAFQLENIKQRECIKDAIKEMQRNKSLMNKKRYDKLKSKLSLLEKDSMNDYHKFKQKEKIFSAIEVYGDETFRKILCSYENIIRTKDNRVTVTFTSKEKKLYQEFKENKYGDVTSIMKCVD